MANRRPFEAAFSDGFSIIVGSLEAVEDDARQLREEPASVEERCPQVIAGTPDDERRTLGRLAVGHGVGEFVPPFPWPSAARAPPVRRCSTNWSRAL